MFNVVRISTAVSAVYNATTKLHAGAVHLMSLSREARGGNPGMGVEWRLGMGRGRTLMCLGGYS